MYVSQSECGTVDNRIRVLQQNLSDALREKGIQWAQFLKRLPFIVKMITRLDCDILIFQEATQRDHIIALRAELHKLGYDWSFGRHNSTPGCTSNLTAWKACRFHLKAAENIQLLGDYSSSDLHVRPMPDDTSNLRGWECQSVCCTPC